MGRFRKNWFVIPAASLIVLAGLLAYWNYATLARARASLALAAKAAAYSGAAVQAEKLSAVAAVNWEMRRALKQFLFDIAVRAPLTSMPCFPLDATGKQISLCGNHTADERYDFGMFDPRENTSELGPGAPTICMIFDQTNNYCQKAGVPGVPEVPGGSWSQSDPIVAVLRSATSKLVEKRIADCNGRTDINRQYLSAWLFGSDLVPGQSTAIQVGRDLDDPIPLTTGLDRLGYLPRMAFLRARIDGLEEALNRDSEDSLTPASELRLHEGGQERSIAALSEAQRALARDGISDFSLSERHAPIHFHDEEMAFASAVISFRTRGMLDRGDCFSSREFRKIPHFPLGVSEPIGAEHRYKVTVLTRIPVYPFGSIVVSASAEAAPFGAAIGPAPEDFESIAWGGSVPVDGRFPLVLVEKQETPGNKGGFTRLGHLGYLRSAAVTFDRHEAGRRLAGAFTPWEEGRYMPPCQYELGFVTVDAKVSKAGLESLRARVAGYLGAAPDNPLLAQELPETKLAALDKFSGSLKIQDPWLRDSADLVSFARKEGKKYTSQPEEATQSELQHCGFQVHLVD